jgi:predicted nucleic acid-binding protein
MPLALVLEYEAVGRREANRLGIPNSAIDDIVDMLGHTSRHQAIHFRLLPEPADPDDEFVLELALTAQGDFVITGPS